MRYLERDSWLHRYAQRQHSDFTNTVFPLLMGFMARLFRIRRVDDDKWRSVDVGVKPTSAVAVGE